MCIKRIDSPVHPELPGTDINRVGRSELLRHLCLPNDMNGCGTDNDGMCVVQKKRLLIQDRAVMPKALEARTLQ